LRVRVSKDCNAVTLIEGSLCGIDSLSLMSSMQV